MNPSMAARLTGLAALSVAACAAPQATSQATPAQPAEPFPTASYRTAVETLVAATRTRDDFLSTVMSERQPCQFRFDISPGRQSALAFQFDVRQLDLDTVTPAQGQARTSSFPARRIACARQHGLCASDTGRPVDFIEVVASSPEALTTALEALRTIQTECRRAPATSRP